jgi:hypothetical protein
MNRVEVNTVELTPLLDAEIVRRAPRDEILRELWEAEERLNSGANYDPAVLIARANETARRLGFLVRR